MTARYHAPVRVRGKGSIVQLEKDKPKSRCRRWQLRVSTGKDPMTGRYVTRTRRVTGSHTEAAKLLREFIAEIESGVADARLGITFADECERFLLARKASGNYSAAHIRSLECCLKAACRHLGKVDIAEVTPQMIDQMTIAMRNGDTISGKPASGTYAHTIVKQVGLVYKQAIREGRLLTNPCENATVPHKDTAPRNAMSATRLNAFVSQLKPEDEHHLAWRLAATMGLRRGEICGLSWGDVDLSERVVNVRHSLDCTGNLKETKTRAGRRALPLGDDNAAALATHCQAQLDRGLPAAPSSPVIVTNDGTRVVPDLLGRWWNRDRAGLGAEGYTLHELRHSYLTQLARAGVHPKVMQELAGHANPQITMDIYTHVDMAGKRAAAEALERSLRPVEADETAPPREPIAAHDADIPTLTVIPSNAA